MARDPHPYWKPNPPSVLEDQDYSTGMGIREDERTLPPSAPSSQVLGGLQGLLDRLEGLEERLQALENRSRLDFPPF